MEKQKYVAELYNFDEENLSFELVSSKGMDRLHDKFDLEIPEWHNYVALMFRQSSQTFHRSDTVFGTQGRYRKRQLAFELMRLGVNVVHIRDCQPNYQVFYSKYSNPDMRNHDAMFVYIDPDHQDILDNQYKFTSGQGYYPQLPFLAYHSLTGQEYHLLQTKMNNISGNSVKATQERIALFPDLQTYQAFCMSKYHYMAKFFSANIGAKIIYVPGLYMGAY